MPPLDFVLETNPLQLGEVVVTGAGTTSEAQKIGNVRSPVDSAEIQKSNESNITTALAGKAPNVQVISSAGDPGASSSITIRGANTLGRPSDPLIVVDGVPIDNSATTVAFLDPQTGGPEGGVSSPNRAIDVNPSDIESVEILKGAAAGAVYGARAGQGVVLITTKRGRAGQTRYSFRSSFASDYPNRWPGLQNQYAQGDGGAPSSCSLSFQLDCYASDGTWGPALNKTDYIQSIVDSQGVGADSAEVLFRNKFPSDNIETFDHLKEAYTTGHMSDNTLTVSGGNERTTFFLSGSYLGQSGTVVGPNDFLHRATVRLKADHSVFNHFRIGGNIQYANTNQGATQKGFNYASIPWTSWLTPPDFDNNPYLDPTTVLHRSYRFPYPSPVSTLFTRGYDNPFYSANTSVSTTTTNRVIGGATLDYTALSWLRFSNTLGVDVANDSRLQAEGQGNSQTFDPGGQVLTLLLNHFQLDNNLLGTASYRLNDNMAGTVTVGNNINVRDFTQQGQVGDVLLAPQPYTLPNTATQRPPNAFESHVRNAGFFGQATLDLYNQLYLKAGLRYDGSSTFGSENQFHAFPSASAAWQFTKMLGHEGEGWLSFGKARIAYGEVGTEPGPYVSNRVYQAGGQINDPYGGLFLTASQGGVGGLFTPITLPAQGLVPERTRELEGGFDLGFFQDRADLSFTMYRRMSLDVILPIPVAASSGYQLQVKNGAQIRNQGIEFTFNVRPIVTKDLSWTVGVLGGTNRNEVLDLSGAQFVPYGGAGGFGVSYAQLGGSVGTFRDYDYVRCGNGVILADTTGAAYDVDANCNSQQKKDHALFINGIVNGGSLQGGNGSEGIGYPILDPTQRVIGSPDPKWTGSLNTTLRYKHWSFSGLLDVRHGGLVWNGTHLVLNTFGTSAETGRRGEQIIFGKSFFAGPTAGPGAGLEVPLTQDFFQTFYGGIDNRTIGAPFYEDGGFTKLREISVGYEFTDRWVNQIGLSSVEVRAAGRNLAVWSGYSGADPEVNSPGSETGARGIDFFSNPQTRSFVFTLTLNR